MKTLNRKKGNCDIELYTIIFLKGLADIAMYIQNKQRDWNAQFTNTKKWQITLVARQRTYVDAQTSEEIMLNYVVHS